MLGRRQLLATFASASWGEWDVSIGRLFLIDAILASIGLIAPKLTSISDPYRSTFRFREEW